MKVKIEVTKNDISRGKCGEASNCPIARAINRTLKRRFYAIVWDTYFKILDMNDDASVASVVLPKKAYIFIEKFDGKEKVKPFTFMTRLDPQFVAKTLSK